VVTDAERILLDRMRLGDKKAWEETVDRFQGRLLAFAKVHAPRGVDPEDLVQEAFMNLLAGIGRFRHDCSLETYLFSILRRRLVDAYRQSGHVCTLQDRIPGDSQAPDPIERLAGMDPSVSWHAVQAEQAELVLRGLAEALSALVDRFKKDQDLDGLMMLELLFYCQLPARQVAKLLGRDANQVRVFKHRCIAQIRQCLGDLVSDIPDLPLEAAEGMLLSVWQSLRLSCPKRNTIGGYMLGTLEPIWHRYVDWHIHKLGCHFCKANLEDLQSQVDADVGSGLRRRIMESTIGFFVRPTGN
jgi:RNA polymerase sigma-70 factor (ECF subfamily)